MTALLTILLGLLSLAVLIIVIGILMDYFMDYKGCIDKIGPKIKFKTFLTFYEINPNRWELDELYVNCKIPRETSYCTLFYDKEEFHFSYIDTYRYHLWYKNIEKRKDTQYKDKATARMLAAVKQDVADLESKAQREINEAKSILKGIYDVKS